jgi:hypothetical protein
MEQSNIDHIDLLDIDVHLHEEGLLLDEPGIREFLDKNVVAVHANTHSADIQRRILDTFTTWKWCV